MSPGPALQTPRPPQPTLDPGAACAAEPGAAQALDLEPVHWMGVRWAVPRGWACVQHSCNPRKGGLVFADRTRPRLQLRWDRLEPDAADAFDPARVLDHYRRRTDVEGSDAHVGDTTTHGPWAWATRHDDHQPTLTRLLRLDAPSSRVLELTVVHADDTDTKPLASTLALGWLAEQTVAHNAPEETEHWRLLGLDFRTPAGWLPRRVAAAPGDVVLTFAPATHPDTRTDTEVTARRRGLLEAWFDGDLDSVLRQQHAGRAPTSDASDHPDFPRRAAGDADQPRWRRWWHRQHRVVHGTLDADAQQLLTLQVDHPAASPVDAARFRCQLADLPCPS